jgi:hypothetical protein
MFGLGQVLGPVGTSALFGLAHSCEPALVVSVGILVFSTMLLWLGQKRGGNGPKY